MYLTTHYVSDPAPRSQAAWEQELFDERELAKLGPYVAAYFSLPLVSGGGEFVPVRARTLAAFRLRQPGTPPAAFLAHSLRLDWICVVKPRRVLRLSTGLATSLSGTVFESCATHNLARAHGIRLVVGDWSLDFPGLAGEVIFQVPILARFTNARRRLGDLRLEVVCSASRPMELPGVQAPTGDVLAAIGRVALHGSGV